MAKQQYTDGERIYEVTETGTDEHGNEIEVTVWVEYTSRDVEYPFHSDLDYYMPNADLQGHAPEGYDDQLDNLTDAINSAKRAMVDFFGTIVEQYEEWHSDKGENPYKEQFDNIYKRYKN